MISIKPLDGWIEMANEQDEGSHGGCGRPASNFILVNGFSVGFHISCSHRKAWMSRLGKGLYFYAIFETITGCPPNINENIGRLRSKVMPPLKVLQCN